MSRYVRNIIFKDEFDGDKVKLTMTPLTLDEIFKLRAGGAEAAATAAVDAVRAHLVKIEGLSAADGTPIENEEVLRDAYFSGLVAAAGMELMRNASPQNPPTPAS